MKRAGLRIGMVAAVLTVGGASAFATSLVTIDDPAQANSRAFRVFPGAPPPPSFEERAAQEFISALNIERGNRGLPILHWHDVLGEAAQDHAEDMAAMGELSHTGSDGSTPMDRLAAAGWAYNDWGESIAAGYATGEAVLDGWLSSPDHARFLLGDYTRLGVGAAPSAESIPYWVLIVGNEHNQLLR